MSKKIKKSQLYNILDVIQLTDITLISASWSFINPYYTYKYYNSDIKSWSFIDLIPTNSSFITSISIDIMPNILTSDGSLTIYAKNQPTSNINATINIYGGVQKNTIIFDFKNNNNFFDIYAIQGTIIQGQLKIDWGDENTEIIMSQDLSVLEHTYNKLNTDSIRVYITTDLNIKTIQINQGLTSFNPLSLPSSLQYLYLNSNELDSFNPSVALPSSLERLWLYQNLLTSFNPSIALPKSLQQLILSSNLLTSFNPSIALPSSLQKLDLFNNKLSVFNPSIALPSSLQQLILTINLLTSFNPSIALPNSLTLIDLQGNKLTSFNPSLSLPSSLQSLVLTANLLTSFNPSIALPSSLQQLSLSDNLLTSFNPSISLPSSLQYLYLSGNQLTSFNPSISLPSSLQQLDLQSNQLSSFNPSVALPNSLQILGLDYNQLTSFNPSVALPSSLNNIGLSGNLLNTTEVNNALILLNNTFTLPGFKEFYLEMSTPAPPSGAGLTAKTELQSKGYYVYTD